MVPTDLAQQKKTKKYLALSLGTQSPSGEDRAVTLCERRAAERTRVDRPVKKKKILEFQQKFTYKGSSDAPTKGSDPLWLSIKALQKTKILPG